MSTIFSLIFGFFKTLFSSGAIILKVLKIVLIFAFLWFVFSFLRNKFNLLSPLKSLFSACYNGIRGGFSLIGIG